MKARGEQSERATRRQNASAWRQWRQPNVRLLAWFPVWSGRSEHQSGGGVADRASGNSEVVPFRYWACQPPRSDGLAYCVEAPAAGGSTRCPRAPGARPPVAPTGKPRPGYAFSAAGRATARGRKRSSRQPLPWRSLVQMILGNHRHPGSGVMETACCVGGRVRHLTGALLGNIAASLRVRACPIHPKQLLFSLNVLRNFITSSKLCTG